MASLSVVIASDTFKGSASSRQVDDLLAVGIHRVVPNANTITFPIADGGEGTMDALVSACGGEVRSVAVSGPLGGVVNAHYALIDGGDEAVIEMAEASGITFIDQSPENALHASTFGVGQVVLAAIADGARKVYVGLGGSATSDGGAGLAKALGARFLDESGKGIPCGAIGLGSLASIDASGLDPRLADVEFVALTDVRNPLCGADGAVYVYGPQKGLASKDLARVDGWMRHYSEVLLRDVGSDVAALPGAGAAGGLGAGLVSFCGASIVSGIDFVLQKIELEKAMTGADLVVTGEGRMDSQSANGKAPVGVARLAKRHGIPVVAVVGSRADDLGSVYSQGIDLVIPTVTGPMTLQECIDRVDVSVPIAGESCIRAYLLGKALR
jgi:glycerate kinase